MRKILALATVGALSVAGVAQAQKPATSPANQHSAASCTTPRNEGYNARGTLVSSTLTASTTMAGRYSGTITVTLRKANHHDTTTTFTLTNARVYFHHGVSTTAPAAGSKVDVHGKITALPRHCSTTGFTPTITVKKVDITAAHS
jgi:hypothetical protein